MNPEYTPGAGKQDLAILTYCQEITSPIIVVNVAPGKVLVNGIRSFWDRQVVQSLEPTKSV